jgi:hypothetical protein
VTTETATSATTQTAFGKAVEKAKAVAGQDDKTKTEAPATATAPTTKPETPAVAAIPPKALAKLPKPVAKAIKAHRVVVLGVFEDNAKPWRPLADDDRYTRNALRKANRYDGDVFVKQVGVTDLVDYGPLVNDLDVHQSPSIVVIDRNLKGTVLTGYVDRIAINQAIADARRASITPNITDSYLRQANRLCSRYETRATRWSMPTSRGPKAEKKAIARAEALIGSYLHGISRTPAPAKWRPLKSEWVKVMKMRKRTMHGLRSVDSYAEFVALSATWDVKAVRKLDKQFNAAGLTDCAINRTS